MENPKLGVGSIWNVGFIIEKREYSERVEHNLFFYIVEPLSCLNSETIFNRMSCRDIVSYTRKRLQGGNFNELKRHNVSVSSEHSADFHPLCKVCRWRPYSSILMGGENTLFTPQANIDSRFSKLMPAAVGYEKALHWSKRTIRIFAWTAC